MRKCENAENVKMRECAGGKMAECENAGTFSHFHISTFPHFHISTIFKSLALAGLCAFAGGCRTFSDARRDYTVNLATGNYHALPAEMAQYAADGGKDATLAYLYAAYGAYMMDSKTAAANAFDGAEMAFLRHDSQSVFSKGVAGATAIMTNDKAFEYDGGGLDRVFVSLYKGIDYLSAGNPAAARTEFNRAGGYQQSWLEDRRRELADSAATLAEGASREAAKNGRAADTSSMMKVFGDAEFCATMQRNTGFDPSRSGNPATLAKADYTNIYAEHVTGVFRWLAGDGGDSYLNDAATLSPGCRVLTRDAKECRRRAKPANQVWVWVEDGLCPTRKEWRIDLPMYFIPYANRYVLYAGMAFPVLEPRAAASYAGGITVSGAEGVVQAEAIQSVDKLVKTEYDVYMRGALAREVTRVLVRVAAQAGFGIAAEHATSRDRFGYQIAQIAAAAAARGFTAADTRCWDVLPKNVFAARVTRPESGQVTITAGGRTIVVNAPAGRNTLVWVRQPSAGAAPVVKQVAL